MEPKAKNVLIGFFIINALMVLVMESIMQIHRRNATIICKKKQEEVQRACPFARAWGGVRPSAVDALRYLVATKSRTVVERRLRGL